MNVGDRVTYVTEHKKEKGIIKSISDEEHVFVVYNCADNWDRYDEYTAARTRIKDLVKGWSEPIWKCQDGRYLELKDMSESHIRNTIKMLERRGYIAKSTWSFYMTCTGPSGEHAQDAFNAEFDYVTSRFPMPWIDAFNEELKRRGL